MSQHYDVRYLRTAQQDLLDIVGYVGRDNPEAAISLLQQLDQAITNLSSYPLLGNMPKDERLRRLGYRVLVVGRYLVFYVIKGRIVQIRRVIHGSRQYSFLL
ncbi:MAG: type II toxin-antitoxin system RelE/ParE family toxin [Chloroflexota bacterium]